MFYTATIEKIVNIVIVMLCNHFLNQFITKF